MVWYKRYEPSQILYGVISWVKSNTFKSGFTDNATPYIALTAPSTIPKYVCNTKCLFIFIPTISNLDLIYILKKTRPYRFKYYKYVVEYSLPPYFTDYSLIMLPHIY